jgi:release factor glutamine methyltransferase
MAQGPRKYLNPVVHRLLLPIARWYLSKSRKDRYQGLTLQVPPGVFHPGLFLSTRLMLKHLERYDLQGKNVLEIGAGSGMIAIWCNRIKGGRVTATDISPAAIAAINSNAAANAATLTILQSDLWAELPPFRYDYIVVNPPYYPKNPSNDAEKAFFCGEGHTYFERFFEGLHAYRLPDSKVLMVLSEDCDLSKITQIASRHHWEMEMVHPARKMGEWSFIFSLRFKRVY